MIILIMNTYVFKVWWIQEAMQGKIPQLPLINVNAIVTKNPSSPIHIDVDLTQPQQGPKVHIKLINNINDHSNSF